MPFDIGGFIYNGDRIENDARGGIVTNGLVLHLDAGIPESYPRSGTTWYDLSGNNYDASLINGPSYDTTNGGVLTFDGVDDYAIISSVTNYRSISLWAFVPSKGSYLFDARTGSPLGYFWFPELGSDWDQLYINGSLVATSSASVPENVWFNLYVRNTSNRTGTINLFSRYTNNEYQAGKYSQFLAYNRALSATEITQNFNAQRARFGV